MKDNLLNIIEAEGKAMSGYRKTNILRTLHNLERIDFCKPVFTAKIEERFTARQIESTLNAAGLDSFNAVVFLIIKPRNKYRNGLHLAIFDGGQLVYNMCDIYRAPGAPGRYHILSNLDYFYRRSDIEEARKNCDYVYIIAQKRDYTTPKKDRPKANAETRYIIKDTYSTNEVTATANGYTLTYNAPHKYGERKTAAEIADKSGYIADIKRNELQDKAQALREERKKAAYLATDNTAIIAELERELVEVKADVIKGIEAAGTYEEMKKAADRAGRWNGLTGIYYDIELLKSREAKRYYGSLEDFTKAADGIREEIEKLMKGSEKK